MTKTSATAATNLPATPDDLFAGAPTDSPAPFVRVMVDKATGRAVVALDAVAAAALTRLLDDIGPGYDLAVNAGVYGLDQADADLLDSVRSAITGPLY